MTGGTWRFPRAVFSIGRMYEMNNFTTCQCGGLAAVIQSRIEKGRCAGFLPIVSRETFVRPSPTLCFARKDF
jgi:hypothetical protein